MLAAVAHLLMVVATCLMVRQDPTPRTVTIAEGKLLLSVPQSWEQVDPRYAMIDLDFKMGAHDEGDGPARLTVMGAGGSVRANVDRWIDQFVQPDGSSTRDKTRTADKQIAGFQIQLVDISGTYLDRPGPQAPVTRRQRHRLLGAIIQTEGLGNYFLKLVGPQTTVDRHEDSFHRFVESIKHSE